MAHVKVALVGAAGETGTSIVNGLLEAGSFVRPSDLDLPCLLPRQKLKSSN